LEYDTPNGGQTKEKDQPNVKEKQIHKSKDTGLQTACQAFDLLYYHFVWCKALAFK